MSSARGAAGDGAVADLEGEIALPRSNGELVFRAPWEGRAFGMAVALSEKGGYHWDDFRSSLVEAIRTGGPDYYESWLQAFQTLLERTGVLTPAEIAARAAEYSALERDPVF